MSDELADFIVQGLIIWPSTWRLLTARGRAWMRDYMTKMYSNEVK